MILLDNLLFRWRDYRRRDEELVPQMVRLWGGEDDPPIRARRREGSAATSCALPGAPRGVEGLGGSSRHPRARFRLAKARS